MPHPRVFPHPRIPVRVQGTLSRKSSPLYTPNSTGNLLAPRRSSVDVCVQTSDPTLDVPLRANRSSRTPCSFGGSPYVPVSSVFPLSNSRAHGVVSSQPLVSPVTSVEPHQCRDPPRRPFRVSPDSTRTATSRVHSSVPRFLHPGKRPSVRGPLLVCREHVTHPTFQSQEENRVSGVVKRHFTKKVVA